MITAPDFRTSKTYVYKYEAVLLGGLPEAGLARAGVKVSSKILISGVAQNTFLLKVNHDLTPIQRLCLQDIQAEIQTGYEYIDMQSRI